jgi:hypothetical protein
MKKQLFTVKILLIIALVGASILLSSYKNTHTSSKSNQRLTQTNKSDKKTKTNPFVGAWVTYFEDEYAPNGKGYFGFILEEDGSAASIMSYTFQFKRWKVKGKQIIFIINNNSNSGSSMIEVVCDVETINDSILKITESGNPDIRCRMTDRVFKKDESKRYPIVNVKNGQKITSPLYAEIENTVDWPVSEGEMGTVTLVDKNNKKLGVAKMTSADGYWAEGSSEFEATLTFDNKKVKSGKLIFRSNKRKNIISKSFEIPVTF